MSHTSFEMVGGFLGSVGFSFFSVFDRFGRGLVVGIEALLSRFKESFLPILKLRHVKINWAVIPIVGSTVRERDGVNRQG